MKTSHLQVIANIAIFATLNAGLVTSSSDEIRPPVSLPPGTRLLDPPSNGNKTVECTTADGNVITGRSGSINKRYRWTNFNIFIDPKFNQSERQLIEHALYVLSKDGVPCIKFGVWQPGHNPTGDYVHVKKGDNGTGCNSILGRKGGAQVLNLETPICMYYGIIIHEYCHALGLHHEHTRHDRDKYIDIHWENILESEKYNFKRIPNVEISTYGVPYNKFSIMHYGCMAFSKNGQKTITAKDGGSLGQDLVKGLQDTDIQLLRRMYNCSTV